LKPDSVSTSLSKIRDSNSGLTQLAFVGFLGTLLLLVWVSTQKSFLERDFLIGWIVIYGSSVFWIARRISREFYGPDVVLLSSYLFLLGIGSVLYAYIRGKEYWQYGTNLFGIGYVALWIGTRIPIARLRIENQSKWFVKLDVLRMRGLLALTTIVVIAAVIILFLVSGIPILSTDINEAKLQFFSGKGYLSIFFRGLPVISLAYCYYALTQPSARARFLSHSLAAIVACFLILTGYRGMTLFFVTMYVSMFAFLANWNPRFWSATLAGIIAIVFLGVVGAFRRQNASVSGVLEEFGILVTARPAISDDIIRSFDVRNYYWGSRYFDDLVKILPGSQTGANVDLKYELFSNAANMPELAGITPGLPAESFMNFGAWWIPVSLFLVGYASKIAFVAMKSEPTVTRSLFYFTFVYNLAGAIQTGIGTKLIHFVYIWFWIIIVRVFFRWRLR